jgi:protease-4
MTALVSDVWLLSPELHKTLTDIVKHHAFGGASESTQHKIAASMPLNPAKRIYGLVDRTAVIPVEGIIGRKFADVLQSSGVTSIDILDRMLSAIAADDEVSSVLMVYDSPGGYSMGVPEVAASIARLNAIKPVIAYVDGQCCSAAYWLAAQSYAIYATQSASVGSIGAYIALLDQTRAAEMQGLKVEMFRSGPHKGMGYPGTSLTEEQRGMLQAQVDKCAAGFKAAVRSGRGKNIADEFMQGQSFDVDAALACGLVDQVSTMDEALRDAAIRGKEKFA